MPKIDSAGGINLRGNKAVERALKALPEKIQKKVLRKAMSKATTTVSREMRAKAPVKSGALRRSIGKRTKSYQRGQTIYGVVGPRSSFEMDGQKPSKYAHLVEFGSSRSSPKPFARPAYQSANAEASKQLANDIVNGAIAEAAKLGKGGGR